MSDNTTSSKSIRKIRINVKFNSYKTEASATKALHPLHLKKKDYFLIFIYMSAFMLEYAQVCTGTHRSP